MGLGEFKLKAPTSTMSSGDARRSLLTPAADANPYQRRERSRDRDKDKGGQGGGFHSDDVAAFCIRHDLDAECASAINNLPIEKQREVIQG
eukprot:gene10986-3153_t